MFQRVTLSYLAEAVKKNFESLEKDEKEVPEEKPIDFAERKR